MQNPLVDKIWRLFGQHLIAADVDDSTSSVNPIYSVAMIELAFPAVVSVNEVVELIVPNSDLPVTEKSLQAVREWSELWL